MIDEDRDGAASAPGQAADQRPRRRFGAGWLGAWVAVLALALWLSQLTVGWLAVVVAAALLWTGAVVRSRAPLGLAAAAALWLAAGLAAGVQYRLDEVVREWPDLQLRVEESAADALGAALDGLVESGELAVSGAAEAAEMHGNAAATPELFARLDGVVRRTGVTAIGLFGPDGEPIAWAGEHRGGIPLPARLGERRYFYEEGPLFSYLYFVRPLPDGVTATAAFLLEAGIDVGEGIVPFAERFERRYGTRPRFWLPERARAEAVWDWATDRPILSVSFAELTQQHWWERVVQNGRRGAGLVALLGLLLLSMSWYRARMEGSGVPVLVGTTALLLAPLGRLTGAETLFSPLQFVLPGPLDVTLGVLLVLLLGASLWLLTRGGGFRRPLLRTWLWAPLLAAIFPASIALIDRSAADGLLAARAAGGFSLQLGLALILTIGVYLVLRHAVVVPLTERQIRLVRLVGLAVPALLGLAVLLLWRPGLQLPIALAAVWAIPAGLLVLGFGGGRAAGGLTPWLVAGWVAGSAALAFLWPLHVEAELARAEREIELLGTDADPFLDFLLRQFGEQAATLARSGDGGVNLLYHGWVASGLAREGYEARISLWEGSESIAELNLSDLPQLPDVVRSRAERAAADVEVRHMAGSDGLHYLLTAPIDSGRVVTVAVPPRRRVAWSTPLARLLHPVQDSDETARGEVLYMVPVSDSPDDLGHTAVPMSEDTVHWVRTAQGWRSETLLEMPEGFVHAHMVVETPRLPLLLSRAVLVQAMILLTLAALWLLARAICRELSLVPFLRVGWLRSFRGRLSLALFFFFLLPTLVFGAISYGAVAREVVRSAAALAQQALDQAAGGAFVERLTPSSSGAAADLLMYRRGALVDATAPELIELGLFHTWLPADVYLGFAGGEDLEALEERRLAQNDYLIAYRRLDGASVLAVPIPLASNEITRRQQEFRDVALLLVLLGLGLSVVLSLLVSRALSSPLDELSRATALVGGGNFQTPLPETRTDEFGSVYASFNRMVRRLRRTRAALVQETRRTETIVAEAATGVLALDVEGRVELVNSRALEILGASVRRGDRLVGARSPEGSLPAVLEAMWNSETGESAAELDQNGRIVRLKLRRLPGADGSGGAVIALEDVTAEVRTARVLAWGEMARQVAHEIKNPLTPIKLAVQHLRRAFLDGRSDFDQILERNVEAILREIDRLSEIARAFSRFGTPAATASPLEAVAVGDVIREVLALYGGASEGPVVHADLPAPPAPRVIARSGELKEVLLNLLENAREAVAESGEIVLEASHVADDATVRIRVSDTGVGIPAEELARVFEPHFSTRTSGTGLGLAIVRRLVESWGGEVDVDSRLGEGTTFEIRLKVARHAEEARVGAALATTREPPDERSTEEEAMSDLKRAEQQEGGRTGGLDPNADGQERNEGAEFGTSERATRGTNRDFDESGQSDNQGHGHPREERDEG